MRKFEIGETASLSKMFTEQDVVTFSELSNDKNPIHLNEEFASKTVFKQRIVHGYLYTSLISALIGNHLPGPGSIYLHQEMNFKKPVFLNEEITAKVTITDINEAKGLIYLATTCTKNINEIVVDGKAIIKIY